jgi:orotidine-5'-phosphate decarboxylase
MRDAEIPPISSFTVEQAARRTRTPPSVIARPVAAVLRIILPRTRPLNRVETHAERDQAEEMSVFREKLAAATRRNRSFLCVGLDVDPRLAPSGLVGQSGWIERFALGIVEATADLVCAFKPNLAFFEALGLDGLRALRRVLEGMPRDVAVIGDAKRGDVGSTAAAYARALFETWGFDAATVSPYVGFDALGPFLDYGDRGVLLLCKTSNPGSGELQDLRAEYGGVTMPIYEVVARRAVELDTRGNCGLVVGATFPSELARVRSIAPNVPILIPGVGAQQGELEASVAAGLDPRGGGIIVNASRGVIYASSGPDWQEAARAAASALRDRMAAVSRERPVAAD